MPTHVPSAEQELLRRAVEGLYAAFEAYPLAPHVDGCPCCVDEEDEGRLHARPLRELAPADLHDFAWSTMWTWGTVEDFKHFLPRLLELAAQDDPPCDVEVLFRKLAIGEWRLWPVAEQLAVEAYLDALWAAVLAEPPEKARVSLEEWLCAIASASPPAELGVYLEYWESHLAGAAVVHLARFAHESFQQILVGRNLPNAFWAHAREQEEAVRKWLASPGLRATLERTFFERADQAEAQAISDALSLLDVYAMSRGTR